MRLLPPCEGKGVLDIRIALIGKALWRVSRAVSSSPSGLGEGGTKAICIWKGWETQGAGLDLARILEMLYVCIRVLCAVYYTGI